MKIRIVILYMIVNGCCAMEESFDSGDLPRLFGEEIEECRTVMHQTTAYDDNMNTRCDRSYEQHCFCRFCAGLCIANGLYTMGRITPTEQHPAIQPLFGEREPDAYVEHGLTCFAAICTIWTMSSGPADHSCICGHCRKTMDKLARQGVFDDKPCRVVVPRPVFMCVGEKKDK